MQIWRVFLKGFELRMKPDENTAPHQSERIEIIAGDEPIEIWFPGLSAHEKYLHFQAIAVGRFTGRLSWDVVDSATDEYVFHLDNFTSGVH